MSEDASAPPEAVSAEDAQTTIRRQAEEITRLQRRLGDERFAEDLRAALGLAAAAGRLASPVSHSRLLEMIVQTAAQVIAAGAGSLLLIDEAAGDLVFEVAVGGKGEEVKKLRVPLGHGVAGLVAATGQPMAISSAGGDARQAHDIAQRVGYAPDTLLCVPLFYHDRVVGVLELLDKQGGGSFSAQDIDALSLFGSIAAVAIEQSRTHENIAALLRAALDSFADEGHRRSLNAGAAAFLEGQGADPAVARTLDLARLVQEIAHRGEGEFAACRTLLQGFADYLRGRDDPLRASVETQRGGA